MVEVLHLALVERGALDDVFRAEPVIEEGLRPDVAQLHPHEAAEVARRHVLDVERAKQLAVVLDQVALAEPRGLY